MSESREWMVGLQGHKDLLSLEEVIRLIHGGQLRDNEMVKKGDDPWRAASDMPELLNHFDTKHATDSRHGSSPPEDNEPETSSAPAVKKRRGQATSRIRKVVGARARTRRKGATSRIKKEGPEEPRKKPEETDIVEAKKRPTRFSKLSQMRSGAPDETATGEKVGIRDEETSKRRKPAARAARTQVRLTPMISKYYSITDLARHAAYAFVPRKIVLAALILIPLGVALSVVAYFMFRTENVALQNLLIAVGAVVLVYGLAFACASLAYMTRRNIESEDPPFSEVFRYSASNAVAILTYPLLALLPTLIGLAFLWVLGFLRDTGEAMATVFRVGYILWFVLGLFCMLGAVFLELALCYVPSSMVVDGLPMSPAVRRVLGYARRQTKRVAFHWLVITTTIVVVSAVMVLLVGTAFLLPEKIFGTPGNIGALQGWATLNWLMWLYGGVAVGLGLVFPVSVLSTFGTLSYLILKQEDDVFVASPLDEAEAPDETVAPEEEEEKKSEETEEPERSED